MNAKDPTLPKLNATPSTLGCYTAGLVLGLNIEQVAQLLISDTGILLNNMTNSNVFNPANKEFKTLSQAIKYLMFPPEPPKDINLLTDIFISFGLFTKTKDHTTINEKDVKKLFKYKRNRNRLRQLAGFVLGSYDKLTVEEDEIATNLINDIKNDPDYFGWKESDEKALKTETNKRRKKSLQERYDKYKELADSLKNYENYKNNPNSKEAQTIKNIQQIN